MVQVNQSEAQGGGIIAELRVLLCASHLNIRDRKKGTGPNAYRGQSENKWVEWAGCKGVGENRDWSLCWNTGPELPDQLPFQQKPEICMLSPNLKITWKYCTGKIKHLGDDKFATSSTGFLSLSTTDILGQMSLCWVQGRGAVLCTVGCLAACWPRLTRCQ